MSAEADQRRDNSEGSTKTPSDRERAAESMRTDDEPDDGQDVAHAHKELKYDVDA